MRSPIAFHLIDPLTYQYWIYHSRSILGLELKLPILLVSPRYLRNSIMIASTSLYTLSKEIRFSYAYIKTTLYYRLLILLKSTSLTRDISVYSTLLARQISRPIDLISQDIKEFTRSSLLSSQSYSQLISIYLIDPYQISLSQFSLREILSSISSI